MLRTFRGLKGANYFEGFWVDLGNGVAGVVRDVDTLWEAYNDGA